MKKVENFCRALKNLEEINSYFEPYSTVELTGMVALYEICFEQAWKAIKEVLTEAGYAESHTGSPKQILKTAYSAGLLKDEAMWLAALQARNNAAHAYNEAIALDIVARAKTQFLPMFRELKAQIEASWQAE